LKSQISYKTLLEKEVNLENLDALAVDILKLLPNSAIVFLNGNLAAGKTTLVSKIVKALGLGVATSPTFSLQQVYSNLLFHYDFYRLDYSEIVDLGLIDEFEKDGIHLIEWAMDDLKNLLINAGFKIYSLDITPSKNGRYYQLKVLNA